MVVFKVLSTKTMDRLYHVFGFSPFTGGHMFYDGLALPSRTPQIFLYPGLVIAYHTVGGLEQNYRSTHFL
jgi:hypothetical protein